MSAAGEHLKRFEALAAAVMAARADDDVAMTALADGIKAVAATLADDTNGTMRTLLDRWNRAIGRMRLPSCEDPDGELKRIRLEMAALQDELDRNDDGACEAAAQDGRFVLPEWVEESIFSEFVSGCEIVLDEIESDMLALEEGRAADVLDGLRGRIHSLKGEAGMLGLGAVEEVCHALEDQLASDVLHMDLLLLAKDWLAGAVQAYSRGEIPPHSEMMEAIRGAGLPEEPGASEPKRDGPVPAEPDAAQPPEMSPEPHRPDAQAAEWDEDALEIVGEFIRETDEGLTQVDEILLGAEQQGVGDEQINAMFRVFHTIKGVAGFLELAEITELAHTTETMLDRGRTGDLCIAGAVLDLVFDATETMRKMVEELRRAVGRGLRPCSEPGLPTLFAKLQAAIAGRPPREEDLPEVRSGDRIGEIVSRSPYAVDRAAVAAGLEAQKASGRRLGEELVAQKAAKPRQVAQALRAQARAGAHGAKLKEIVKIDLDRVDSLVALIGELVIVESMVVNAPELSGQVTPWLRKHLNQMAKITRDLQDIGTRMRMVPVRGVFQKMARMVRDLSHRNGKAVTARVEGEGTEMDRAMVEQIADPLVHMIRNAVDHGIEEPDERTKAGKPPRGTIELRAFHQGGNVVIEVADDGRGLDRDAILNKAREKGIVEDGANLTDPEVYSLIFAPGFSTAKEVTEISGRGVGMDVVRRNIEAIRGRVTIDSQPGRGSTFTLMLPLTLAIIDGLLVACGPERYIVPTLSVLESIRPDGATVFPVTGRAEIVSLRGETFPLLRLSRLLNVPDAVSDPADALVVVVESRGRKIGIMVDDVLTQQQVVIKSLDDGLPNTRYLSGAAIMSDGRVGLILNTDAIGSLVDRDTFKAASRAERPPAAGTMDGSTIRTAEPNPAGQDTAGQQQEEEALI